MYCPSKHINAEELGRVAAIERINLCAYIWMVCTQMVFFI